VPNLIRNETGIPISKPKGFNQGTINGQRVIREILCCDVWREWGVRDLIADRERQRQREKQRQRERERETERERQRCKKQRYQERPLAEVIPCREMFPVNIFERIMRTVTGRGEGEREGRKEGGEREEKRQTE
jgi:hypothetical protein